MSFTLQNVIVLAALVASVFYLIRCAIQTVSAGLGTGGGRCGGCNSGCGSEAGTLLGEKNPARTARLD